MSPAPPKPERLLVAMPSWVGDCVMATPALRSLRDALPDARIGALFKPGPDILFDDADLFDRVHIRRPTGVLGPKRTGFALRTERYDTALLLSNAFSTALIARVAGIPRRVGYRRDARGPLITDGITPPTRPDGSWAPVPAVEYYWTLANHLLRGPHPNRPDHAYLELPISPRDRREVSEALARAALEPDAPYAVLIPGGNKDEKRWPRERFAALARHLHQRHRLRALISGAPAEHELCAAIADLANRDQTTEPPATPPAIDMTAHGMSLRALKPLLQGARLVVTNDTGPRHIAVALATPVVTLFGPTDHRWTTVPTRPGAPEVRLLADPTLREDELANDDPERNRIDRIPLERVTHACDQILTPSPNPNPNPAGASESR